MASTKFRSGIAKGIEKNGVDRENKTIKGFSVISEGEARGHDLIIDKTTLEQVVAKGNERKFGVKTRFGHPNMSSNAFGTYLGRTKNFRLDGDRVRADLELSDTAFESNPKGNLGNYVLELAEKDADMFGASIVFDGKPKVELDDKDNETRFARVENLYAADVVDDPATGDGLFFSESVQMSAKMTKALEEMLSTEDGCEKIIAFLDRFREHNVLNIEKVEGEIKNLFNEKENKMPEIPKKLIFTLSEETQTEETQEITNKEEGDMADKNAVEQKQVEASQKEAAELAAANEKERIKTITALGKKFGIKDEVVNKMIDDNVSLDASMKQLASMEAAQMAAVDNTAHIDVTKDEKDNMLEGVSNSFLLSSGVINDRKTRDDVGKSKYRGMSLQSFARECLANAGEKNVHLLSADELYSRIVRSERRAFDGAMGGSTGDFVNALSNTANKAMAKGWEESPTTYQMWTATGSLSDFKTADIIKITSMGDVQEIPEGEAPRTSAMTDSKETAKLSTWGSYYTLTRQALVNDDKSVFTRVPRSMVNAYRRKINKRTYGCLLNDNGTNANFVGPTMTEDAVACFNSAHSNYVASGSGAAISQSTLNTAWTAMVNQTLPSPDGGQSSTIYGNIRPRYFLAGPAQEVAASKLFGSQFYSTSSDDAATGIPVTNVYGPSGSRGGIIMVIDPEIDGLVSAYTPWYLAGDQNMYDTVTVFGLNGETMPQSSSEPSSIGEAEGIKWQIRGDFVVKVVDWRALYLNVGK